MTDFESISGYALISVSFIFTILAVMLKNKPLRFAFLILVMISLPLNIAYMLEMVKLHNTEANLGGLIELLTAGLSVTTFTAVLVIAFLIIELIRFVLARMGNLAMGRDNIVDEPLEFNNEEV